RIYYQKLEKKFRGFISIGVWFNTILLYFFILLHIYNYVKRRSYVMINTYYRYKISAVFTYDNHFIDMPDESITALVNNCDYNAYNMPILYLNFRVNSRLYDLMVTNANTAGRIILTIKKYDRSTVSSLDRKMIEHEFSYIMPTDPDYHRPLDQLELDKDRSEETYKVGTMALIGKDTMDDNSVAYNDIIKNSNLISIVNKYTQHMNMVIEPFVNNERSEERRVGN